MVWHKMSIGQHFLPMSVIAAVLGCKTSFLLKFFVHIYKHVLTWFKMWHFWLPAECVKLPDMCGFHTVRACQKIHKLAPLQILSYKSIWKLDWLTTRQTEKSEWLWSFEDHLALQKLGLILHFWRSQSCRTSLQHCASLVNEQDEVVHHVRTTQKDNSELQATQT